MNQWGTGKVYGYPTDSGLGSAIGLIRPVAINSKSENKEAAWEFVKYYIVNAETTGFPTYVPNYEEMLMNSLESVYLNDGEGLEKLIKVSYREMDGISLYVYNAEIEDVEIVRKLIDNTNRKYEYETEIQLIIEEESKAFLRVINR